MNSPASASHPQPINVLTVGEAMASLRARGPLRLGGSLDLSIAGSESNVAIALARLGHDAAWVGRVGADPFGQLVLRTLRAEGVDVGDVRVDPDAPTGMIVFEPASAGRTRVEYRRAGSAGSRIEPEDLDAALARGARVLHVSGITAALSPSAARTVAHAVRGAKATGTIVCLDVNHRSRLWSAEQARRTLTPLLASVDIVVASPDELALIADAGETVESRAQAVLDGGPSRVVVKDGVRGAWSHSRGRGRVLHAPARKATAVDTVGAGDAFTAGYLSALLDDADEPDRLRRAVTVAAFAVSGRGDWESLPDRDDLALLDLEEGETVR